MKGMRKVSRGDGFRGVLDYNFSHDGGRVIAGNMAGDDARSLSREFGAVRRLRPDISKPVWHQALRLPPGEKLTDEKWAQVATEYVKKMGFSDGHPFVVVKQDLEGGDHVHIVASRIASDGSVFLGKNENLLSTKVAEQLEKSFSLAITASPKIDPKTDLPSVRTTRKKMKRGEIELSGRTGIVPPRAAIQLAIDAMVAQHPAGLPAIRAALAQRGVTLHIHSDPSTNKPRGLSFEKDGIRFSGSQLGEDYKFKNLSARLTEKTKTAAARPAAPKEITMKKHTPAASPDAPTGGLSAGIPGFGTAPEAPPTLGGRIVPVLLPDNRGFDLFWADRMGSGKPSFRWTPDDQRLLILGQPSEKSVAALFDLANEKGIGMPLVSITGTPEFQRMAAQEAARRGLPVDTGKLDEAAREIYRATFSQHHGDSANSISASAYESQRREEQRIVAEREAEQQREAAREDRQQMKMRG
jgi:hypothetical protein